MSYQDSLAAEQRIYENCVDVHGLPPIFHYWTARHLLPKFQSFGIDSPVGMFRKYLEQICATTPHPRFVSLGAGNGDTEIELARALTGRAFTLDCLDVNPAMLERGRLAAERASISQLNFIPTDLNHWNPSHHYDAVIANQSLHHVVNLEALFENVQRSLRPGGLFLISDMIGRNGHQRWPEALAIVHEFWARLPPSYRVNQQLSRYEELYENWDCSAEGFEGVRAQDILPLLAEKFHFHLFLPYGNVIDPFIDRAFGPHFDPASAWDRAFIDAVHLHDERELSTGRLTPTHMVAVLANEACAAPQGPPPQSSIRPPHLAIPGAAPRAPYDWTAFPHDRQKELEIACRRLSETTRRVNETAAWGQGLALELEERTAWAIRLEKDMEARTIWARAFEKDLEDRTQWALRLQKDLEERTRQALELRDRLHIVERDFEERTAWALRLQADLAAQTSRAGELDREIHSFRLLSKRLLRALRRRIASIFG